MNVFLDTNVVIDALTEREGLNHSSLRIFRMASCGDINGFICCKQLTDIYYILRDYYDTPKRRRLISFLIDTLIVVSDSPLFMNRALQSKIPDLEDAFIDEVANSVKGTYLVTKNVKDFAYSKNIVVTPKQVLEYYDMESNGLGEGILSLLKDVSDETNDDDDND